MARKKTQQKKNNARVVKKALSKSSNKTKNSVSTPISGRSKPRTYKSLPNGYRVTKNAKVVNGAVEIHNGKPLFKTNKNGQRQVATDRNGKPAHKKALLVVDPVAHTKAKTHKKFRSQQQAKRVKSEEIVTVVIKTHRDSNGGHPHIIIEDIDDQHVSVGLTSDKYKGKGHTNIKLQRDPLDTGEISYMKRQGTVDKTTSYEGKRSGALTKEDHKKAKQIGAKAKQKYLKKKNKQT